MVELATRVMVGEPLAEMGYGVGLYKTPPYYAVKVPVFSFEKLNDVNSALGPEMKSTGEVLGIGKTLTEALFKGLTSAGFSIKPPKPGESVGVLIRVDEHERLEIVNLAKKLDDLGVKLYAISGTAEAIAQLGIDVVTVEDIQKSDMAYRLLESGRINYIVYTGAMYDATMEHYVRLHRRAVQLSIACLTSLDTANALADIIASRYNQQNTELIDINHMRSERQKLSFAKMQGTGNDYIFFDNRDGIINCPESLCVTMCRRHYGIGGTGIILIENADDPAADAKMRVFNRDGSEGAMAGNGIRCVGKYLYDNGIVKKETMVIETNSGLKQLRLHIRGGRVSTVTVDMGKADMCVRSLPATLNVERAINYPVTIGGKEYRVTCLSVGNPHCVIFCDRVDSVDVERIGPQFEHADIFPQRVNVEFIRVVNDVTIKMRVWERGNGETWACGTGACAAVIAAVENGFCRKGKDITVKLTGGDLVVNYTDERVTLNGPAELIYEGVTEY